METRFRAGLRYGLLALLCLLFAQATLVIRATSQTIDEGLHITSGATILRAGDYRLVEEHPPLTKLWMALPVAVLSDLDDFTALPVWLDAATPTTESLPLLTLTKQWLYPYASQERIFFAARAMNALLGVLLLAFIARWACGLYGPRAALLAVACAAFDPNLIAHSAVAGTDVGAAVFICAGLWASTRFLRRPTGGRAITAGVLLGLALASKLTAVLLGPALAMAGLVRLWRVSRERRVQLIGNTLLVLLFTGLALWGVYGFEVGRIADIPLPLPAPSHAIPWMRLMAHNRDGHQAYLLGSNSNFGWLHYFPVAFVLKTPLAVLVLLVWALLRRPRLDPALSLFAVIYIVASLTSQLNIGYRHLLPLLPLMYVVIGSLAPVRSTGLGLRPVTAAGATHRMVGRSALLAMWGWLIIGTLAILPYPLSYFNELVGGPDEGWRYLADSNTDWGQGYKALAEFQADRSLGPVKLSAFIFFDPVVYGVAYTPLTPLGGDTPAIFPSRFAPPPGDYVISVTPLNGIPTVDPEMYDWFRWRAPDAKIAHALFYYHVTPEETATAWLAQCATHANPLDAEAVAEGFGVAPSRQLVFDCMQAWVIPATDAASASGVYAVHGRLLLGSLPDLLHLAPPQVADPFVERHLAGTDIIYRQRAYRAQPSFALYRQTHRPAPPVTSARIAPAATALVDLATASKLAGEIPLQGPLTFLGVSAYTHDAVLEVETWWRVTGDTGGRPASLMAHLLGADGAVVENADGLAFSPDQWRVGDIIVQRHRFPMPSSPPVELLLRTGAYWLDDGARWPVEDSADAIFIDLTACLDIQH
jgi:hypothetical protein